jgi:hypothetical protein
MFGYPAHQDNSTTISISKQYLSLTKETLQEFPHWKLHINPGQTSMLMVLSSILKDGLEFLKK